MRQMLRFALVTLLMFIVLSPSASPAKAAPVAAPDSGFTYYPQTGHNINLQVKPFYEAHGGLAVFGLPLTEVFADSSGQFVQYFERARFEIDPTAASGTGIAITRVGSILTQGRTEPAFNWLAGNSDPSRVFFPESGHTMGGAFQWFWEANGGLTTFGYPISEEFVEINHADGNYYLSQYFERGHFEYHPENAGTPYEIILSHLGRELLNRDPSAVAASAPAQPITLLGEATTAYNTSGAERVHNIGRATEMFDQVMVPAGTDFAFSSVGDFSSENGFVDGYAIVGGRLETVIGGGLCQVSTTMFRAASNAGMEITERHGHSHVVYFYENTLGFDATIFTPYVDFRWRNDTSGPVYITTESNPANATVTFRLWGYDDGRQVRYDGPYTRNWTEPSKPAWQYDSTLAAGSVQQLVHGRAGVDVNYIRTVTNADGTQRRYDDFFTSYQPWEDFYIYGPGITPPAGATIIEPR